MAFAIFPHIHLHLYSYFRKVQQPKNQKRGQKKKKKQRNSTAIIEICASHRLQLRRQLHIFIYADIFQYIFKLPSQSAPTKSKKEGKTFDVFILSHKFNAMMYEIFNFPHSHCLEGAANKFYLQTDGHLRGGVFGMAKFGNIHEIKKFKLQLNVIDGRNVVGQEFTAMD